MTMKFLQIIIYVVRTLPKKNERLPRCDQLVIGAGASS